MKLIKPHLILALILLLVWPALIRAAPSHALRLTLQDLELPDLTLNGMLGSQVVWIPFPSNLVLEQQIEVNLIYRASPLLNRTRSTLTVLANDHPIASLHPVADGMEQHFSFTILPEHLQGQGVALRFQSYLRLTDLDCEETDNPGQWLIILNQTDFAFAPALKTQPSELADLPQAIVVQNAIAAAPPVLFVLPDNPDSLVLTTAARVAIRLGQGISGSEPVPFEAVTVSQLSQTQKREANLVVIGLPKDHTLIDQLAGSLPADLTKEGFLTADGVVAPAEHGLVQIFNSPWNDTRKILLVSAGGEAGLQLAGQAFAQRDTAQSLRGSFQFIRALEPIPEKQPGSAWLDPQTTFAQLDQIDRKVVGTGIHQEFYYFRRPPGWVLDNGSQLALHLNFSPALRASESYVTAFINEVHVGTARPGNENQGSLFIFDLPVALLNETAQGERSQTLTLRLEIANFLTETNCEVIYPETAWTKVLADSYFVTPHVYLPLPDLQALPYPFISDHVAAPTTLVVPPQPDQRELGAALSLAGTLGRLAPTDFSLFLLPADQVSAETQAEAHLIILGARTRQPLIDEFQQLMGAIPGYSDEKGLYQTLHSSTSGLLREGPSPWNEDRVALLVTGETGVGFENALKALIRAAPPVNQSGSVALVEADQPLRVIYHSIEASPDSEANQVLREPSLPRPQPWLVVTAVLVVTTGAVLGLIWFSRRQAGQQRGV